MKNDRYFLTRNMHQKIYYVLKCLQISRFTKFFGFTIAVLC